MKYNTKLLIASSIPIIVYAVVTLVIGFTQYRTSLYNEKQGNLKSAALAAMALYSGHGYGDYGRKDDGKVWRGMNFNVSDEVGVVDDLKEQTGIDITFFYGDVPEMTSVMDSEGVRSVKTAAGEYIRDNVLTRGAQIWCRSIVINGGRCQAYIIPIKQSSDGSIGGALMASQSAAGFDAIIMNYVLTMVAAMLIILAGVFLFIRWYVNRFSQEFYEVTDKSKRDLLTGLYNKRSFEEESKAAISEKREGEASVLLILDFDNFKHVNDNYGHQVGDEVLKSFALILGRAFRTKDIIGRVGGDEFMVYMPEMPMDAVSRADEISREILHELNVLRVGTAGPFSCSIGIGTDVGDYDFDALYKLADSALYESKERGKACYVRYSSDKN